MYEGIEKDTPRNHNPFQWLTKIPEMQVMGFINKIISEDELYPDFLHST